MWDSWDSPIYTCVPLYRPILCVRPIPMSYMGQMGQSYRIPCVPPYRPILHVCVRPILSHCPMWDGWNSPMESHVYHSTVNSLHAADLYIDFMNNSLAKKEKREKESYQTGVRTQDESMRIVLATHQATRAITMYLACMDLINLSVQYGYATITQHYRVQ